MRIRQIRPEFFTDPVTGRMKPDVQVAYIGLWIVADDAGWLEWDIPSIGALLYPYRPVHTREALIVRASDELVRLGRLTIMGCGCARIPTLQDHQRIGGNKSFTARERHQRHGPQMRMDLSAGSNVTLGNGSNGTGEAAATPHGAASLKDGLLAAGLKPSIAGKAS
jgi:hypothetical protein